MKQITVYLLCLCMALLLWVESKAQITKLTDYQNNYSATIGTFQGINFREAGFSGLCAIPNTNGKEFWTVSDRGVNIDAANANSTAANAPCAPTYDKIYAFPSYVPKIHRIRVNGDSIQILQTITIKRPGGTGASGIINPTGYGSTASEVASTDTVLNCANFNTKVAAKDIWGIDSEGILVDKDGNFWICEEGGPTIWKLNSNGVVQKRYSPYANLAGAQAQDVLIDTIFKYRKNNRGFEGIAMTPNGKVYAIIQSPLLNPTKSVGEGTRVHRILEIDPTNDSYKMYAYLNDSIVGASGANQIRLRDWKIGDMVAINNTEFLVIEAAIRGTSDIRRVYKINIANATPVTSGLYSGVSLEALVGATGLTNNGIVPVTKTLVMDLLANGWPVALDKAEGLTIIDDSTIAIANDNDYGQTSPLENGIATATTNKSHVIIYRLQGANKLVNYSPLALNYEPGQTGPSTSTTPYLLGTSANIKFTSLLSVGDAVAGYKMVGLPDGTGAYDNGNGTFTFLVNHEVGSTQGVTRAHGSAGAFVSKWVINKTDLTVISGADLIQNVKIWNGTGYDIYNAGNPNTLATFNRFCSADLPSVSAFYNSNTGLGTQERIFMNGEESGDEGRAFGHIATGAEAGTSYHLPRLGRFSWENSVACPTESDKTIVVGMDDSSPGQVYVYVGTKTNTGTDVDKAGLTNGKLYGVAVTGYVAESNATMPAAGSAFTLYDFGDVSSITGATLNANSNTNGVTTFLRPEDGAWDPSSPNDFYFVTTNGATSPSRLWKLHFNNLASPENGGTITAVLDGTEGQKMLDNMAIDHSGHVILQEDIGGNIHNGKTWEYTIATDALTLIGKHDETRFITGGANFLTIDEEASGAIDVQSILGPGMFLVVDQAHYNIAGELVQGGQILAMYNPNTATTNPEINVQGNGVTIVDGETLTSASNNTDLGSINAGSTLTKTFTIQNSGAGSLAVSAISFAGTNAAEFSLTGVTLPMTIAVGSSQNITVQFTPTATGTRSATLKIVSNDYSEIIYDFVLQALSTAPEVNLVGNSVTIADGDATPSTADFTDFGSLNIGGNLTKTFTIQNTGSGSLAISAIAFSGTNASEFTLMTSLTYPLNIAAGASEDITVQFAPTASGTRLATLTVTSDDADEATYDFALQGLSTVPEINLQGNSVTIADGDATPSTTDFTDFGSVNTGSSQTKTFTIQNTGDGSLSISGITFTGTNASEFTITTSLTFPVTIAAGASQVIIIQFTPVAAGARSATLNIASDDANEATYDVSIQGLANIPTNVEASVLVMTGLKIYPNPAGDFATISLNLEKDEKVIIRVFDDQGKEVVNPVEKNFGKGEQQYTLNTSGLRNGSYYVQLTAGDKSSSIKTVVTH